MNIASRSTNSRMLSAIRKARAVAGPRACPPCGGILKTAAESSPSTRNCRMAPFFPRPHTRFVNRVEPMANSHARRKSRDLSPSEQERLKKHREEIANELPDLVARDRMRKQARE